MIDRFTLYNILYALVAKDGRDAALFGNSADAAFTAFGHSLAGEALPELWFEIPLAGDPWFDLHALTSRDDLTPEMTFSEEQTGGCPSAFQWFASQPGDVRQLALSWDTGKGEAVQPAVQLLVTSRKKQVTCGFLEAAGRPDAVPAYCAFVESLPKGWFPCYAGVFPGRPDHNLRVECIPHEELQAAYAEDPAFLESHLRQVGLTAFGDTIVPRCQLMAKTPFKLEFQFDVDQEGRADATFSASLRFAKPPREGSWEGFSTDGAAGELMRQVGEWGLADGRWRLLEDTIFAKVVEFRGESCIICCYPAFLKLRWRDGEPVDAKAYLIAGTF